MRKALVRQPGSRLAEGIVTHLERRPLDLELAGEQWRGYVAALAAAGWDTVEVPAADDCPDAVFIEDTLVLHGGKAVVTRPGAESRRGEIDAAASVAEQLGFTAAWITAPGTLDGGDVLAADGTVYVGVGGRTNAEGARQLAAIVGPVITVPVSGFLHLKSAVTALPDGTIVGCPPLVPDTAIFDRFLAAPEPSGAHVVDLGGGRILLAADCPRSAELYAGLGFEPVAVEIGEFQKLEGCVTCLSVLAQSLT